MEPTTRCFIVTEADNISTDITVSPIFSDHDAASVYLREQFARIRTDVFGERELKDDEQADRTPDGYTVFDSKGNDLYYGQVKEITIPVPAVPRNHGCVYLLTCQHTHNYGTDVNTSLHYTDKDAENHVPKVMADMNFEPEAEEYFSYEVFPWPIDVQQITERKE